LNPYIKYQKTLLPLFSSIFWFSKSNELQFEFPDFALKQQVVSQQKQIIGWAREPKGNVFSPIGLGCLELPEHVLHNFEHYGLKFHNTLDKMLNLSKS
jgi:hypothetical protein